MKNASSTVLMLNLNDVTIQRMLLSYATLDLILVRKSVTILFNIIIFFLYTIVTSQPMFPTGTPEGPKGSPSFAQGAKVALAVCLPLLVVVVVLLAVSVVVVRYVTMKRYTRMSH